MTRVPNPNYKAIILSGPSKGFDQMVAHLCAKYPEHKHLICIPPSDPQAKSVVPLTQVQLNVGMPNLQCAGLALRRIVTKATTWPYLQRNVHLVSHAKQVFAFGKFDDMHKHVEGGVGWTVRMAKQRNVLLFVFDLDFEEWWWWDPNERCFRQCEGISEDWITLPTLAGMTTLVGSQDTPPSVFPHLERLFLKPPSPSGTFTFKCVKSLQMSFCLCLDMDGFHVGSKFLVREIGWYAPLPNGNEAYGVQHFTHDYTWDMLSPKDQKRVHYVKRHITGLCF